ncbi:unnamed protein product [Fusarium fujikuroi]|nr:unnamed protein product [Fusarium fujikuroi]
MNPPLPRPEPAKLYRGTRSGSLQDQTCPSTQGESTGEIQPTLDPHPGQDRRFSSKGFYLPCAYPVPTLDRPIRLAYPAPRQNQAQTSSRTESVQVFPAPLHLHIILFPKYKHTDTAPLNNFFTFTYPEARDGPRPGRIAPSHVSTDGVQVGRTPDRTRGPLLNIRKIQ